MKFSEDIFKDGFPKKLKEPAMRKEWTAIYKEMVVHTRGIMPKKIIESRRPNEDKAIFDYRVSIYEPVTKDGINKAIDVCQRIFSGSSYSLRLDDEKALEYIYSNSFEKRNYLDFIQTIVFRRMIEDPNGWLFFLPVITEQTESNQPLEVKPLLVESERIEEIGEDYVIFLAEEKSQVKVGKNLVEEGKVYYTFTEKEIYKTIQIGEKSKEKYETELYYSHNSAEIPGMVLGGNLENPLYFNSFFGCYNPMANEAIRLYTDWQAVMVNSSFPYREELVEDCSHCTDGYTLDDNGKKEKCEYCSGTGQLFIRSPFGVYRRRRANAALEQPESRPMLEFISPPMDVVEFSSNEWRQCLTDAKDALNLIFTDAVQSGKAKLIDREGQYSMLAKISDNVFDNLIYNGIKKLLKVRSIEYNNVIVGLVKPISFVIKTEQDLIDEISTMTDKGVPQAFIRESLRDLSYKRFGGNERARIVIEITEALDELFGLTEPDKLELFSQGVITKRSMLKSIFINRAIATVISKKGIISV
jgi:hypothetical protein